MATAVLLDTIKGKTESIFPIDYPEVQIEDFTRKTIITEVSID